MCSCGTSGGNNASDFSGEDQLSLLNFLLSLFLFSYANVVYDFDR